MPRRDELRNLLVTPSGFDVAHAALLLEQEEHPTLQPANVLKHLDRWAATVDKRLGGARAPAAVAETVAELLFEELGFRGNKEGYYQPDNSHLSQVVERRLGIPISLSLLYLAIGYRLSAPMAGIGFPGHFLLRIGDEKRGILVDPFGNGRVLDKDTTLELLRQQAGPQAELSPAHLQPLSAHATLARMQRNLKLIYLKTDNFQAALDATDRIVFLQPDDPEERRDRGLLFEKLECFSAAQRDFEMYLEWRGQSEDAPLIRERLLHASRRAAAVH